MTDDVTHRNVLTGVQDLNTHLRNLKHLPPIFEFQKFDAYKLFVLLDWNVVWEVQPDWSRIVEADTGVVIWEF